MNSHTPKWIPNLEVGFPMEPQFFKKVLHGLKFVELKKKLYHWKDFETQMSKMRLHDPFEYLKHKLQPKKGSGIKVPI